MKNVLVVERMPVLLLTRDAEGLAGDEGPQGSAMRTAAATDARGGGSCRSRLSPSGAQAGSRRWAQPGGTRSADRGRLSIDPVVFFQVPLILFPPVGDDGDNGAVSRGPNGKDGSGASQPFPVDVSQASLANLAACAAQRHDGIGTAGRPNRQATRGTSRWTADVHMSTTDPDATPMRLGDGRTRLGYQDHSVVDGGRARIILTTLVAPGEVHDHQPALDPLWRTRFRGKRRLRQITGDTTYGTVEQSAAIERERMHADMPLSTVGLRTGMCGEQDCVSDAAADSYHCPGGHDLRFLSQCETTGRRIYLAPTAACAACGLRSQCTTSHRGRRISRSLDADTVERVRGYHQTATYATAIRKRRVLVEPLFAEAKNWHGLRRSRLRGLERVNGEALLIAAGQNLKRLLGDGGWGRRPFPGGAAGVVAVRFDFLPQSRFGTFRWTRFNSAYIRWRRWGRFIENRFTDPHSAVHRAMPSAVGGQTKHCAHRKQSSAMILRLERDALKAICLWLRQAVEIAEPRIGHGPVRVNEAIDRQVLCKHFTEVFDRLGPQARFEPCIVDRVQFFVWGKHAEAMKLHPLPREIVDKTVSSAVCQHSGHFLLEAAALRIAL